MYLNMQKEVVRAARPCLEKREQKTPREQGPLGLWESPEPG